MCIFGQMLHGVNGRYAAIKQVPATERGDGCAMTKLIVKSNERNKIAIPMICRIFVKVIPV